MFGYIGVVPHPFYAVTDANGAFEFPPGLPPGKYTLEATHLKAGTTTLELEVKAGGVLPVGFALEAR
jgi:hypothetical protein